MLSLSDYLKEGQTVLPNLLLLNYTKIGLTSEELVFWQQLYRCHQQGDDFPDLTPIANSMGATQQQIYQLLNQLVLKGVLAIETVPTTNGRSQDRYDFQPIWEKLGELEKQTQQLSAEADEAGKVRALYQTFQEEFGRTLSPLEFERIGQWLEMDKYAPELIRLALKEAVLNQAMSLNYIEKILLNWESRNIKTPQQVEGERERRRRQQLQKEAEGGKRKPTAKPASKPKVTLHNWLEDK